MQQQCAQLAIYAVVHLLNVHPFYTSEFCRNNIWDQIPLGNFRETKVKNVSVRWKVPSCRRCIWKSSSEFCLKTPTWGTADNQSKAVSQDWVCSILIQSTQKNSVEKKTYMRVYCERCSSKFHRSLHTASMGLQQKQQQCFTNTKIVWRAVVSLILRI